LDEESLKGEQMLETFSGFVRRVVRALNRGGIQYMLTGALAASYYGRPRTTLDMDVVVTARQKDIAKLASMLRKAYLKAHEKKLATASQSGYRIATVEDKKSPHTLDIIFTNQKLERNAGHILGLPTYYQTPESLILAKLRMLKVTLQAERAATDREDIKAILKTTQIDLKTLRRKARAESTVKILEDLPQSKQRHR
jgi:hypothetical protein